MPIRPAAVAGTWYPGSAGALTREVDRYLDDAPAWTGGRIRAIMAPHAGLMFSGPVGAHAYKAASSQPLRRRRPRRSLALRGVRRRVDLAGRSVRRRRSATPRSTRPLAHALMASPVVQPLPAAHQREHSLEMQLPFVRRLLSRRADRAAGHGLPDARDDRPRSPSALAAACDGRRILIVASTDLSHYFDATTAQELDGRVAEHVGAFDATGSARDVRALSRARARPLRRVRRRAGDRRDDGGAGARCQRGARPQVRALGRHLGRQRGGGRATSPRRSATLHAGGSPLMLTDDQRAHLLALARASVDAQVRGGAPRRAGDDGVAGRVGRVRDDQGARRAARLPRHAAESRRARRAKSFAAPPIRRARIRVSRRWPPASCPSSRSRSRSSVRSRRSSLVPTRSPLACTAWSSSRARAAGCCCRRWRPSGAGRRAVPASDLRQGGPARRRLAPGRTRLRFAAEVFGD